MEETELSNYPTNFIRKSEKSGKLTIPQQEPHQQQQQQQQQQDDAHESAIPNIGQILPPFERIQYYSFLPWFIKEGLVIVRFDLRTMHKFGTSLIIAYGTFLMDRHTWNLLFGMFIVSFIAGFISNITNSNESVAEVGISAQSLGQIQVLMSFVIMGYVSLVVNRWFQIRNTTFGALWGSAENIIAYCYYVSDRHSAEGNVVVNYCREDILRYARLLFGCFFQAARKEDNLQVFKDRELLKESESEWLTAAELETRPYVVLGWIWMIVSRMQDNGVIIPDEGRWNIQSQIEGIRNGICSTLAILNCPYPYAYVHMLYWVIQIYIWVLSVETGIAVAQSLVRQNNGDQQYQAVDYHFPLNPSIWLVNDVLQTLTGNIVFCLFIQGLMKCMYKLQHPFHGFDASFPERGYDAFLHNNCCAMLSGLRDFDKINAASGKPLVGYSGFDGTEDGFETEDMIDSPLVVSMKSFK